MRSDYEEHSLVAKYHYSDTRNLFNRFSLTPALSQRRREFPI